MRVGVMEIAGTVILASHVECRRHDDGSTSQITISLTLKRSTEYLGGSA